MPLLTQSRRMNAETCDRSRVLCCTRLFTKSIRYRSKDIGDYNLELLQDNSRSISHRSSETKFWPWIRNSWAIENRNHQKVYLYSSERIRDAGSKDIVLENTSVVCSAEKREFATVRSFQTSSNRNINVDLLRGVFGCTSHMRWSDQPSYERLNQRLEEIREGNQPDNKPLILDTEYTTTGLQLMEFFIDLDSIDLLINTLAEHSQSGFVEKGEYKDRLPSDDNCIPFVPLFRQYFPNLEPEKQFHRRLAHKTLVRLPRGHQFLRFQVQHRRFVILVGGFGRSLYLHQRLQDAVGHRIDVLQQDGEKPWTAVLRGAVLHGLARTNHPSSIQVTVALRVSPHNYGTLVNILPFDAKEHDTKDRVWDEGQREFLAVEQTRWFVEIGSSVSTYDPVCASFWQDLTSPDDDLQIDIVASDASTPPTRKDDSVKPMCIIKASELPRWDTIPVWTNEAGQVFHRITYELRMISDGSSLDFQVFYKNKSIASGSVVFDTTSQNDTDDEDDEQMGSPQPLNKNSNSNHGNNIIDMTDTDSDSDYVEAEE
ncbi:related to hsp70 protein [Fusarium fujikuroi]|uniref:Related to hsp70 protein n=1 Tax=Gibberella fujikuroi (strain CBS 195.34 / IMI 58289 / NRRL A-6831) TaxID=1279085 RepID=S0DT80_GIBF5|nr:related to hsp70 protein [Fusarium fujikuroi IMI 58289]KLP08139.1 hsp70 protein [Fusarium fujikuroi]KLP18703.1 hsp70 protein [Fusarium fujikuroi]CCT65615.1 related to hsp70 protein [Fusarium fujikuroi IMI 58289]SCN76127.1 related to hsp70 protein [Fusarium fujikuroi]SCN77886.1 related to hsp70 protein [Fusarium fujikuroi]